MNYHYQTAQHKNFLNRTQSSQKYSKYEKTPINNNSVGSKYERGNSLSHNMVRNNYTDFQNDNPTNKFYNININNYNIITNEPKEYNFLNKRSPLPKNKNNIIMNQSLNNEKISNKFIEEVNEMTMKNNNNVTGKNDLNRSVTASEVKGGINNSPSFNKPLHKPKSGSSQFNTNNKLDNHFNSYKNASLNSPVNLSYNSLENRVNYSNQLNNKMISKPYSSNLSKNCTFGIIPGSNNVSEIYNPAAKSTKEYCYKEEKNDSYRGTMEDFCKIVDKYMGDNCKGLFCLYDGHGGSQVVKYVKDRMPEVLSKSLIQTNNNVEKAFISAFQKLDDEFKLKSEYENVGTTATVVYLYKENDIIFGTKRILYCANVGDSRAILISTNEVKRLTYDHKSSDDSEASRIRKMGGIVFNGRVFGQLALSRAIGDHAMKKFGVIPTPYITKHAITERDLFVVICSDGVWDVVTESDIFQISLNCNSAEELSDIIVKTALNNGSRDNISCLTIKIN